MEFHTEQKMNHKPRICRMVKGPNGFGFSLNMIKNKPGLFINEVLIKNEEQEAQVVCWTVSSLPSCKQIQEKPQKSLLQCSQIRARIVSVRLTLLAQDKKGAAANIPHAVSYLEGRKNSAFA